MLKNQREEILQRKNHPRRQSWQPDLKIPMVPPLPPNICGPHFILAVQARGAAWLQQLPNTGRARDLAGRPLSPPQHSGPLADGLLPLGRPGELLAG